MMWGVIEMLPFWATQRQHSFFSVLGYHSDFHRYREWHLEHKANQGFFPNVEKAKDTYFCNS